MRHAVIATTIFLLLGTGVAHAQTPTAPPDPGWQSATERFSIDAGPLVWWFKRSPVPVPLVTDNFIGEPSTQVLLGGNSLDTGANGGLRVTAAYTPAARRGIEGSVFYIPKRSTSRSVSSSGQLDSTDLLLPFFDVTRNVENVTELSFSPIYRGDAREKLSHSLLGAELSGTWPLSTESSRRVDVIAGVRYLRLRETFTFTTNSVFIPPNTIDIWNTRDEFDATNNFYGAQIGLRAHYESGSSFARGTAKLAMGAMVQSVDVDGTLVTNDFNGLGSAQTFPGGYLAVPTNSGSHNRTAFAVVPELELTVGYRFTRSVSVFMDYSVLYASDVVRPAKQIDRNINPTQSIAYGGNPPAAPSGPAQPSFKFNSSDFWAQGIRVGVAVQF